MIKVNTDVQWLITCDCFVLLFTVYISAVFICSCIHFEQDQLAFYSTISNVGILSYIKFQVTSPSRILCFLMKYVKFPSPIRVLPSDDAVFLDATRRKNFFSFFFLSLSTSALVIIWRVFHPMIHTWLYNDNVITTFAYI